MNIPVEVVGDVAVVTVPVQELDSGNTVEFKQDMGPVLEAHPRVVLDLGRLQFVDSSGLGAFLSCLRRVNLHGGDLKLCRVAKPVIAIIQLVRMHRMLDILPTREEAVRAFSAPPAPPR